MSKTPTEQGGLCDVVDWAVGAGGPVEVCPLLRAKSRIAHASFGSDILSQGIGGPLAEGEEGRVHGKEGQSRRGGKRIEPVERE